MNYYTDLATACRERNDEWQGSADLPKSFRVTELLGEVGEVCNVVKKLERERLGIRGSRDTLEHLVEEIGDVVICLVLIANDHDIPFDATFQSPALETATRHCARLGVNVGELAHAVAVGVRHEVQDKIDYAVGALRALAAHYDIDLDRAAAAKFNETSRKVGLNHFMQEAGA